MAAKGASRSKAKTARASAGLSAAEKAALKETIRERRGEGQGEAAVLARIASMSGSDRTLGKRVHAIVRASAPDLMPKLWYGMPAYANKEGKVVCFFQDAAKFKARYATLGFQDQARIDQGTMWPTSFALKDLTAADEERIAALVKKAVS